MEAYLEGKTDTSVAEHAFQTAWDFLPYTGHEELKEQLATLLDAFKSREGPSFSDSDFNAYVASIDNARDLDKIHFPISDKQRRALESRRAELR